MRPIIDRGRGPEIKGTRVTVYDVLHYREAGRSATWIAALLSLSTEEVESLIRYIEEHKEEVMAVHRKIEERIARGNPPEVEAMRQESHARMLQRIAELKRERAAREEANGASDPG